MLASLRLFSLFQICLCIYSADFHQAEIYFELAGWNKPDLSLNTSIR